MWPLALCLSLWSSPPQDLGGEDPVEEPRLILLPLGDPDPEVVRVIAARIETTLRVSVTIAAKEPLPPEAWFPDRKRWRADRILDHLAARPFAAARVAAVTDQPISTTKGVIRDWGIAGLGELPGRQCVFSTFLYRGLKRRDRATYLRYVGDLALHEIGHTLGLPHCDHSGCLMADAKGNALRSAAQSQGAYCARCARTLGRLRLRATDNRDW
jgi:archaemetzincin